MSPRPRPFTHRLVELRNATKYFGSVIALKDVSLAVHAGEVHALLGDNGAGKSTLIKILSGVHQLSHGEMLVESRPVTFGSPREALDAGIATVFQDLAMVSLMSVTRNFFLGREPAFGRGPWRRFDTAFADRVALSEMRKIGIEVRDPSQAVGTLSGGERQCLAIARAVHFGAKVLILDEPTSALGVKQAAIVLRYIAQARSRNLGVVFISHNVHHVYPVADTITILNRGQSLGTFEKAKISREQVFEKMSGGRELAELEQDLSEFARVDFDQGGN